MLQGLRSVLGPVEKAKKKKCQLSLSLSVQMEQEDGNSGRENVCCSAGEREILRLSFFFFLFLPFFLSFFVPFLNVKPWAAVLAGRRG